MLSVEKQKAIIEGMLFISPEPVPINKMVRKVRQVAQKTVPVQDKLQSEVIDGVQGVAVELQEVVSEVDGSVQVVETTGSDSTDSEGDDVMKQLMDKQQQLDQEISASDIKKLLQEIETSLVNEDRGIELVTVAKGYQFRTKYEVSEFLKDEQVKTPSRLSPSSLEALAIIAYEQPVSRQRLEQIRGVDCGGVVKTLLEKGFVKIIGRSEEPGRPLIYGTTKRFLEVFSLNSLKDLPSLQDFRDLQLSKGDEPEQTPIHGDGYGFGLGELADGDVLDISESEQAILDDLDDSLKQLKVVEKEVVSVTKPEEKPVESEQPEPDNPEESHA